MTHISCTMQSQRYPRYHYIREDLKLITGNSVQHASTLRIAQQKTDDLIKELRLLYAIPVDQYPPEELLWFSDFSPRVQQDWSLGLRGKSSYERGLPDLVAFGYLRCRIIAYRDNKAVPYPVATDVYQETLSGKLFIVVMNDQGDYFGTDRALHNARAEGYSVVARQYLYCFEAVNAAIAALDGLPVAEPVPRWNPQKKAGVPARETNPAHSAHPENTTIATSSGDFTSVTGSESIVFKKQNTIPAATVPTLEHIVAQSTNGENSLRSAPWLPETCLSLLATVLPVPPKPAENNAKALEKWNAEWTIPCQDICAKTEALEPRDAWEMVGLTAHYMVDGDSPSYWRTGRRVQTPTTARHLAKHLFDYFAAFKKGDWYPRAIAAYDGPSIFDEQQSYTSIVAAPPPPPVEIEEVSPQIVESTIEPRPLGMTRDEAEALCRDIAAMYPGLRLECGDLHDGCWTAGINTGDDAWFDLYDRAQWERPDDAVIEAVEAGLAYADPLQVNASPPLITALPEPDEAMSIEAIEADLRGSLLIQFPQPAPTATPPKLAVLAAKQGLAKDVVAIMLDSLAKRDTAAQLHPLDNGRYIIQVGNTSIDTGAAWARWVRAQGGTVCST